MAAETHDFRGPGWTERKELREGLAVIYWPPGALQGPSGPVDDREHYGIEHRHQYPDGTEVIVAPRLDQHEVRGPFEQLTVSPSVGCDCGLHGWLTVGAWIDV